MPDPAPNPELLRSLGRLVRGLSTIFWGLPCSLIVCFYTARSEGFIALGAIPPLICTGALVYGLHHLAAFQPREREWRAALDRATLLGLVNFGLSPFLHWSGRMPGNLFFLAMVMALTVGAILFLGSLNQVLHRLGALLPDEGLRLEVRQFTGINLQLLRTLMLLAAAFLVLAQVRGAGPFVARVMELLDRSALWFYVPLIPLVLLPLALTMAMLWKIKEIILESIFGGRA